MKKMLSLMLAMLLVLMSTAALADNTWDCSSCGATGLTSNFCMNCGAARPVKTTWDCPTCGNKDLETNFCMNCGTAKPTGSAPVAPVATAAPVVTAAPVASTPVPAPVNTNTNVQVGSIVTFGRYEQDANHDNGPEALDWIVLDVQNDKALLMTRYGLYRTVFNERGSGQTWHNSTIREWLNGTFLNKAFTADELNAIQITHINEGKDQLAPGVNSKRIGKDTDDRVFLLSYPEMERYLTTKESRMCIATNQARAEGCNVKGGGLPNVKTSWWWLRTPAYKNNILVLDYDGTLTNCYLNHTYGVARPVIWVDVNGL